MPAKAGIQNLLILSDRISSAFGGNDFYWISVSIGITNCGLKIFYISITYKFLLNFSNLRSFLQKGLPPF